jgi:hypothetical protein
MTRPGRLTALLVRIDQGIAEAEPRTVAVRDNDIRKCGEGRTK